MRSFVAARGQANKPLWITEIGWPTQAKQVQMLPGVMAAMNSRRWWTNPDGTLYAVTFQQIYLG